MPYAMSGSTRIYYETHGEGPAIVFIHGSGGHHAAWWQQTAYFMRNYKVVTVDLRGFGNSDPVPEGPDSQDFPEDILAVLDHAQIEKAVMLGQSIGAAAALKVAMAHPQRAAGVILAHSLGGMQHPEVTPLVQADRAQAEKIPVIDRLLTRDFQQNQREKTFLFQQMGTFNQATMRDLRNLNVGGPTLDQVKDSGVPICFLAGENDAVLSPATVRAAHALLPESRLTIVANAPHSMYWETPAAFNEAVHGFLKQLYGA
jgi:pimeloyl-ACP methyl ester carboxylesterase